MTEQEQLKKFLSEEQKQDHDKKLSILDALRRTRASRGGTGAPLQIPGHLKQPLIIMPND